jgi:hypothetical protein
MAQDEIQQKSAKYRSATGEAWSGDGEMPQLLKQVLRAGYTFVAATTQGLLRVPSDRATLCFTVASITPGRSWSWSDSRTR